jgi:hypothetical protein
VTFLQNLYAFHKSLTNLNCLGAESGAHERRLLNDLMANYNKLERPVVNESDAVSLSFGLTLQQIIDVVSQFILILKVLNSMLK